MVIYKTTNNINGKIYVGKCETGDPNYLGSGLLLQKAIQKYGRDSFKRETLQVCKTRQELNQAEIEWIFKLDATNPKIGYNIAKGGMGGALYHKKGKEHSQYGKGYLREGEKNGMYGKKHSAETLEKIRNRPNRIHKGSANGNFGKGLKGKDNGISIQIAAINFNTNKVIDLFDSREETIKKTTVTAWSLDRILKNEKTHYKGIYYEIL